MNIKKRKLKKRERVQAYLRKTGRLWYNYRNTPYSLGRGQWVEGDYRFGRHYLADNGELYIPTQASSIRAYLIPVKTTTFGKIKTLRSIG